VGIADDGGADQDEDAGADDRPDAERGEIPGREGFLQTMLRVVCVREDLFNRFCSEESADQRSSLGREDDEGRRRTDKLLFLTSSSIAGPVRSSRIVCISHSPSRATAGRAGGAKKRLEQSPVERVSVEEKFRMPLDAKKEAVGRRFDRLHDTIGGQGAGDQ